MRDYADIARLTGLTRARVTQIINLTLLAPMIQEQILMPEAETTTHERAVRSLGSCALWGEQCSRWQRLR